MVPNGVGNLDRLVMKILSPAVQIVNLSIPGMNYSIATLLLLTAFLKSGDTTGTGCLTGEGRNVTRNQMEKSLLSLKVEKVEEMTSEGTLKPACHSH